MNKGPANHAKSDFVKGQPSARPAQNFGLTKEEFDAMVIELQKGEETLFERVFLSQFEDCIKYLMFRYKINRSQAYDVSMDALLKFRKRLLSGKITYGNMRYLFTRMASQFLSDSMKHPTLLLEEHKEQAGEEELQDEVLDALDLSWNQLGKDCRKILDHFYYQKIALKTLSIEFEKSESALRKQKQRCLEKLRAYFLKFYQ